jgi:hypothetical protein
MVANILYELAVGLACANWPTSVGDFEESVAHVLLRHSGIAMDTSPPARLADRRTLSRRDTVDDIGCDGSRWQLIGDVGLR